MKTIKITMIALLFSAISTASTFAKTAKSTMDILTGTVWQVDLGKNDPAIYLQKYSSTLCSEKLSFTDVDGVIRDSMLYYLSDKIDTIFDNEKVGKAKDGKYLIYESKLYGISVFEIIKIDETECIMGAPGRDIKYATTSYAVSTQF